MQTQVWRDTTLLFGLSVQDEAGNQIGEISDEQFAEFIRYVVTPIFPQGLTVFDCNGQYLNGRDKVVEEKSKCVLIVHCDDDSKLQYICDSFRTMYGQESVLISSTMSQQCLRSSSSTLTPTCNDIESIQESIQKLATENRSLIEELHKMKKRVSQVEEQARQHHLSPVSLYSSIAFFAVLSILSYMFYLMLSSGATGIPLQTWNMISWIFPSIALLCLWMMWCTHALPLLFHEQSQRPPSCSSSAIP